MASGNLARRNLSDAVTGLDPAVFLTRRLLTSISALVIFFYEIRGLTEVGSLDRRILHASIRLLKPKFTEPVCTGSNRSDVVSRGAGRIPNQAGGSRAYTPR
jgi:hypothetical protein